MHTMCTYLRHSPYLSDLWLQCNKNVYLLSYCLTTSNYGITANWNGSGFGWRLDMHANSVRDRDWTHPVISVVICRHRFPGHTKTTILRIWLISFRSWSSRIFRFPSITVFMLVILSWTVEKPSLHSRFRRANSSFCVAAICSRRATILFSKCWIKNLIKSFFEYRSFLTF